MLLEIAQEHLWHFRALLKSLVAHAWTFKRSPALQLLTSQSQPVLCFLGDVRHFSATLSHGTPFLHSGGILAQCVCGSQGWTQAVALGRPSQLLLSHMAQGTNSLQGTGDYREGLSSFCPQLAKSAPAQRLQAELGSGEMSTKVSADVVLARGILLSRSPRVS